jgi:hypothetical protein
MRAARHAAGISDKRAVVAALLAWGAQALLLDTLRGDELSKLSVSGAVWMKCLASLGCEGVF